MGSVDFFLGFSVGFCWGRLSRFHNLWDLRWWHTQWARQSHLCMCRLTVRVEFQFHLSDFHHRFRPATFMVLLLRGRCQQRPCVLAMPSVQQLKQQLEARTHVRPPPVDQREAVRAEWTKDLSSKPDAPMTERRYANSWVVQSQKFETENGFDQSLRSLNGQPTHLT